MAVRFVRDSASIRSILMQDHGQVAAAHAIAASVRAARPGVDVVVDVYETDRLAASVTIRDPRARGWEVRDGILSRAAAAQGLEVTRR